MVKATAYAVLTTLGIQKPDSLIASARQISLINMNVSAKKEAGNAPRLFL